LQLPAAPGRRPVAGAKRKGSAAGNLERQGFYQVSLKKSEPWNAWLRSKVAHMVGWLSELNPSDKQFEADVNSTRSAWVVLLDDDTYVLPHRLFQTLRWYDFASTSPLAVGRKFHNRNGVLLGGGPGIALSRAALDRVSEANCIKKSFPIISKSVPGGDGWLGQ